MPDISNQMSYIQQLQDVRNPNSTMGALDRLGSSIGNAWQGYEAGTDQQALTKFFMENPVSPETIQAFSASHPRMPQMEIFKGAGMIAAQKKAQTVKDASKTYANFWIKNIKEGKTPTPQEESAILETMDPEARDFIFKNREQWMKSYGPEFKEVAHDARLVKMKSPIGGAPEVVIDAVSAVKEKTDADRAVQILMKKTNPDTNLPYTEDEAYIKIHHPVTPKEDLVMGPDGTYVKKEVGAKGYVATKTPQIRSVDRGDVVDIYEDGVKVRTEKKGKLPGSAKEETPAEQRTTAGMIANAETVVLKNMKDEGAGANADLFNQYAAKPYVYKWNPNKGTLTSPNFSSATWEKVTLPVINGKQVLAKDVYDTAEKHGMTYDEVLQQIMKAKK